MDQPIHEPQRPHDQRGLTENELHPDPILQFDRWFDDVFKANVPDPNVMILATAGPDARPSARVVLMKGFNADGFVFYSNYESRKARDLDANPHAAACFWWSALDRQVRIEGRVEKLGDEQSDAYFAHRARESQAGTWASTQSRPLSNRRELEDRFHAVLAKFKDQPIPRPAVWGGYRLRPDSFEFWQGRPHRLHDRFLYELDPDGRWRIERLYP